MEKLRSVNTKFWNDPFIEKLDSKEKLLFIYFLTNPQANILGIYEISLNRISFDTGLKVESIEKALKGFERVSKVFYLDGFIILANFQKNQNMNSNMEKGAIELFKKLPNKVKSLVLDKALKGFERLSNGFKDFEKYESESESESELKNENDVIFDFKKSILNLGVEEKVINEWLKIRKSKKASNSEIAFNSIKNEIEKSNMSANKCIEMAVIKSWRGFEAEWIKNIQQKENIPASKPGLVKIEFKRH
ncbi:MAG: hypothetical protein WC720_05220 [Candidatus Shapirobacteria bacterium]|jgi:hypothetical protein